MNSSRQKKRAGGPHHGPRRIVAPEPLEPRNAPGAMLPWPLAVGAIDGEELAAWFESLPEPAAEVREFSTIESDVEQRDNSSKRNDSVLLVQSAVDTVVAAAVENVATERARPAVQVPPLSRLAVDVAVDAEPVAVDVAIEDTTPAARAAEAPSPPVVESPSQRSRLETPQTGGASASNVTGATDTGRDVPAPVQASAPLTNTPALVATGEAASAAGDPETNSPPNAAPPVTVESVPDEAPQANSNVPSTTEAPRAETTEQVSPPSATVVEVRPETLNPQISTLNSPAPAAEPASPRETVPLAEFIASRISTETRSSVTPASSHELIAAADVPLLLERASGASASDDAIIAVVDRGGRILGVRVEDGVMTNIPDADTLVFAIDGAVAKARTAAFFSNNDAALTSRTVRFISQTTITQREVESNPNSTDPTERGPGFVAPIGLGSHFPPDIRFTPHVDLVAIEHTNRDSVAHPGLDRMKQEATVDAAGNVTGVAGDDIFLGTRFNAPFDAGQEVAAPESYGLVSGMMTEAQGRGIGTLPGGIPLYKNGELVGGIGVFFPGTDGQATFEQGFVHAEDRAAMGLPPQTTKERTNAPKVLEAEFIAAQVAFNQQTFAGIAPLEGYHLPVGRIDLVGITLEGIGPHRGGLDLVNQVGGAAGAGTPSGMDVAVTMGGATALDGRAVPEGWLVSPRAGGGLAEAEVREIIERGIAEANLVRSAIRLPLGTRSRMVLGVADLDGNILGLFRMPDATVFSIDVAVAKARNVAYYADAAALRPEDMIDTNGDGTPDVAPGVAFTNRTFRFLATAFFPSGIDGTGGGPFSILNDPNVNPQTAENLDNSAPADAADHQSVLGFDAFNPGSNFREPVSGLQNGVVFFPGSTPLYRNGTLVGGFGISGDGVDQDDVVTFSGAGEFLPRRQGFVTRADQVFVDGVRLPYQKFLRNPRG